MALRTFETADAQYYLGLGNHLTSSAPIFEDVDLGSLDFMVLEGDSSIFKTSSDIFERTQYAGFERVKQQFHKPIYLVDDGTLLESDIGRIVTLSLSEGPLYIFGSHLLIKSIKRGKDQPKMNRRELFNRLGKGIAGAALLSPAWQLMNSFGGDVSPITELNNLRTNIVPTYCLSFRDAVAARKISNYLVPRHRHSDNSKVQVGIVYGTMHSGIETKLKHPWIADATIWLYHTLMGIGDNDILNIVMESKANEDAFWELTYHDCGLFK